MHYSLSDGGCTAYLDTYLNEPDSVCTLLGVPDVKPHFASRTRGITADGEYTQVGRVQPLVPLLLSWHGSMSRQEGMGRGPFMYGPDDFQADLDCGRTGQFYRS